MSAYRVVLLDCDLCGEVCDLGPMAVGVGFGVVRQIAKRAGWRVWKNVDVCPNHAEMTMPGILNVIDERFSSVVSTSKEQNENE